MSPIYSKLNNSQTYNDNTNWRKNNYDTQYETNDKFNKSFQKFKKEDSYQHLILSSDSSSFFEKKMVEPTTIVEKTLINIKSNTTITSIQDLIQLTKDYPLLDSVCYNIDMKTLHNIVKPLNELNDMIGMQEIKINIVDQILFYIQGLHNVNSKISNDYLHTIICGPPGTGKTEVAKIIGKIFANMGILNNHSFKKVTRSDLVAGYLGQTAIKTREVIQECLGGVLFIDEAYSLGSGSIEKKDSFSKECIDTLCEALSEHKNDLMVIIAGYENELEECLFTQNKGLKSRFSWKFKVNEYTSIELYQILLKKIKDSGWSIHVKEEEGLKWIHSKMNYLKYFGRDIEILFSKIKISHAKRIFCNPVERTILTMEDLEKGFELFTLIDKVKKEPVTQSLYNFYV